LNTSRKEWIKESIEQLESTIELFQKSHDMSQFRHKKAFACNRKHKHFQAIDHEQKKSFFERYRVRLDVQGEVIVV
jgi:hypothetical protein